jgi:hypothetical protein
MTNLQKMDNSLQDAVRTFNTGSKIHIQSDLTMIIDEKLIFLTGIFKRSDMVLGFWSHSPWGIGHDREKGFAVINTNGEMVHMFVSESEALKVGGNSRKWRSNIKSLYGELTRFSPEWEGIQFWNIKNLKT